MGKPAAATGCMAVCPFGAAPSALVGLAAPTVLVEGKPAMTMRDNIPMANVPSFGLCSSPANPAVAAATAAAFGVLTPMPCIPVLSPWINTAMTTLVGGTPALTIGSSSACIYGGNVQVVNPGTVRTFVG